MQLQSRIPPSTTSPASPLQFPTQLDIDEGGLGGGGLGGGGLGGGGLSDGGLDGSGLGGGELGGEGGTNSLGQSVTVSSSSG